LDLGYGPHEVTRNGNEHREFVPVNVYPTADGYAYVAIGNDVQWARLTSIDAFSSLASPTRATNEGRRAERESIHEEMRTITPRFTSGELVKLLGAKGLVAAPIHTIPQVVDYPAIREALLETQTASGRRVRLPPPSVERKHLVSSGRRLPYAPGYGRDTARVLTEAGFSPTEISELRESGITA
jgi:crotonobetainyl-CoA:carnitine CoA-transferase CaiB-like acyl-CoA transferase